MKTGSSASRRRHLVPWTAATLMVVLAGYVIPGELRAFAQQQTPPPPRQGPQSQKSPNATGGTAAGPGEGGQAVSADPAHGQPQQQARPGLVAYPDRPKAPAEQIARGKATFSVNCAFCHGSDAGGGSVGPNLLRSEVVLQDQNGENIAPIVHGARVDRGMPKIDLTDAQVQDVAAWLHSLKTGGNMKSTEKINIVVGNAEAGKQAFDRLCGSCHSVTGNLQGFAAKYTDPRAMQQAWIMPVVAGGRGPARGATDQVKLNVPDVTATITQANGTKVTGKLDTIDDFFVAVSTPDGVEHRYTRNGDVPKVEIHDPLAPHRELLRKYNDKDIHDITAYLQTLK
jgi:cytochrome c oxidase cbb3-type subunit III